MRKCITIILVLLSVLGTYIIGQAKPLYDKYWEPGTYTVEITEEDQVRLAALWEQVEMLSAGTKVREASDAETLEVQYEKYLQMGEIPERVYDDVGPFTWAAGLPDEEAISQEEAYIRAYMALEQRCGLQQGLLLHSLAHTSRLIPSIQNGRLTLFAMTVRNTTRPPSLCTPMTAAFVEYNMKCRMSKGGKSQ